MRVLIVDDDVDLCELIRYSLEKEGYLVDAVQEGDDGLRWMEERAHDLVLLDRMLPRMDGTSILRRSRESGNHTPVLMMTALGEVADRIEGLDLGADDYIVKPFHVGELLARVRALIRRPAGWENTIEVNWGGLRLDPLKKMLVCGEKAVPLSRKESDLLEQLLRNVGQIIPRSSLFARVWGPDAGVEEANLDTYIYFARRRLKEIDSPLEIVTVRSSGYCLQEKR